jgi:acetyl-CoA carboxylase biotin carboxyl carrier protein
VDIRKVKKLIELLEESGVSEIEIHEGEESVRISRYPKNFAAPMPLPASNYQPPAAAPAAGEPRPPAATEIPAAPPRGYEVTSPMVGTFYASPSPGSKPFVEIGSTVKAGDVLCIIEAMKMMNQIESEVAGRVVSIMAETGSPVEFGQPLFIIEP